MKQRILQIVLAVLALGAAFFGARYYQNNYLAGVAVMPLPVPANDIAPYTLLDASMFKLRDFPRALVSQGNGYVVLATDLVGKISAGELLAGQPVPVRMAVTPSDFRLADPSLEVISLPAESVNAVGGQVHIGDKVNIYLLRKTADTSGAAQDSSTPEPTATPEPVVVLVATVPVVDVLSADGQPATNGSVSNAASSGQQPQPMNILVVAAPPETVQAILNAVAMSKFGDDLLWITLATP